MIVGGGLSGGISSIIADGDFWKGMRQGLITSGLNHMMHMSYEEYNMNKGRLVDLKKSGEGPHVSTDFIYPLSLGKRLNKNALDNGTKRPYDIIVKYEIYNNYYDVFITSPYVFIAGSGLGGSVFSAARKAGLN